MSMKIILVLTSLLCATFLFSQDSNWNKVRVNEDLTISLPGQVITQDTIVGKDGFSATMRVLEANAKYSTLRVVVTPNGTKLNVNDRESLRIALEGISTGICKTATDQGLDCMKSDTTIDRIESKKIVVYNMKESTVFGIQYVFLVNDRMYLITQQTILSDEKKLNEELKMLINSIHFNHIKIKEQKFESKAESTGYGTGYLFGQLLGFLLIGTVVWFVFKKIFSKSKKHE
jgi:hypothetical protein